jgi:hypothetical protein
MNFVYQGFTHKGNIRSFTFQGRDENKFETSFSIHVNLLLLSRYRLAMQDAPAFCLQMLTSAYASSPGKLEQFKQYQLIDEDLLPLVLDREKRATQKALKAPPRRFGRKPPIGSHFRPAPRPEV